MLASFGIAIAAFTVLYVIAGILYCLLSPDHVPDEDVQAVASFGFLISALLAVAIGLISTHWTM